MTDDPNEHLVQAVTAIDVDGVREALAAGADPNHVIALPDGYPRDLEQPTTPLKLVLFRISDSFVDDAGLRRSAAIARLLVDHGADPRPAMALAEARYGPWDPSLEGPFAEAWQVVARAAADTD